MTRLTLVLGFSVLIISNSAIGSPLPSKTNVKITTSPAADNYHHRTDSDPHIDPVYDQVTLPISQINQDDAGERGYFFPKPAMSGLREGRGERD